MAEIVPSIKNQDKRTQVELIKRLMRIRQNLNSCLLKQKEKTCKTRENFNFRKKGKIVISVKTRNFSRSWMTKRISSLESSREI